jgi:hypothetical protein
VPLDLTELVLQRVTVEARARSLARVEVASVSTRLWALSGALGAVLAASLILVLPHLSSLVDVVALVGQVISATLSAARLSVVVLESILQVLEPIRDLALVGAAALFAIMSLWLHRRLSSELLA